VSLEVRELYSGYYSEVDIVKGISLKVPKGQVAAVIGSNGCGKSTLLKTIYGFIKPRKGEILFNGVSLIGKGPEELCNKLKIAFIPQSQGIFPELTVLDNLKLRMWVYRKDKKMIKDSIARTLEVFPLLKEKLNKKAGTLSGGMRKMLEVAGATLHKVQFVLLDEPTAGLAPKVVSELVPVLEKLKEHGVGMMIVEHNIKLLLEIADYVFIMSPEGTLVQEGPSNEFKENLSEIAGQWLI